MGGTIPLLLLYAFRAWPGTTIHLPFYCYEYFQSLALKGILTIHRARLIHTCNIYKI